MSIEFPEGYDTPAERLRYVTRALEQARQLHNAFGAWARGEASRDWWETLPEWMRAEHPWREKLPETEFRDLQATYIAALDKPLHAARNELLAAIKGDDSIDADIDLEAIAGAR